jgi:ligand-binding sensor domain-containing protein
MAALAAVWAGSALGLPADRTITQYVHRTWQLQQGTGHFAIRAIAQTADGYLWFGTRRGLARFDGVRFTFFQKAQYPRLPHDYVEALLVSRDGSLWLATRGGLARFAVGVFTPFTRADGLGSDVVRSLAEDRDGALWIATTAGLSRYQHGRFTTYTTRDGLPADNLNSVSIDRSGRLWVSTASAGLAAFDGQRFVVYPLPDDKRAAQTFAVRESRDGTLWVGTSQGLCRIVDGRLQPVRLRSSLSLTGVRDLHEDHDGNLWLGAEGGIVRVAREEEAEYTRKDGLAGGTVWVLFEDREGTLWVGSEDGGLDQFTAGSFVTVSTAEGLPTPATSAILETRDGSLWIGTREGLARRQGAATTVYGVNDGLPSLRVGTLCEGRDGSVWIGTSRGLVRLKDGRIQRTYTTRDGLSHDEVRAIYEDSRGDLWVGTMDGLDCLHDGRFTRYGPRDGLPSPIVWLIHEARDGSIWFGGLAPALLRYRNGTFMSYTKADGIPAEPLAMAEDASGTLWVGTGGGGLVRIRDGRLRAITEAEGLPDHMIVSLVDDGRGSLWLGSNGSRGIFRIGLQQLSDVAEGRRASVEAKLFGTGDGIRDVGCVGTTSPSALRTRSGRLWFATADGAVSVDPEHLTSNPVVPHAVIETLRMDGREVPLRQGLSLPPSRGDLEFEYTATSFRMPERVALRYWLQGYDATWVEAGGRRTAYYTRVPPGRYTFRVMARNEDGVWSGASALTVALAPAFYQTGWFHGLELLALSVVLFAGHLARLARARAQQAQRVSLLQEREEELASRVKEALAEIKVLNGLLPICASCKKIRDDRGYWNQIETYISARSEAEFSHGLCPECAKHLYPEYPQLAEKAKKSPGE